MCAEWVQETLTKAVDPQRVDFDGYSLLRASSVCEFMHDLEKEEESLLMEFVEICKVGGNLQAVKALKNRYEPPLPLGLSKDILDESVVSMKVRMYVTYKQALAMANEQIIKIAPDLHETTREFLCRKLDLEFDFEVNEFYSEK
jgi:hypothetical protein